MRPKLICLFLALCLAILVGIVMYNEEAVEKKAEEVEEVGGSVKEALPVKEMLKEPKEAVEKEVLSGEKILEEPSEAVEKKAEEVEEVEEVEGPKTIQGPVRTIDRTAGTITLSGVTLDAGSADLSEVYVGDFVKVTYQSDEKVIESIEVLPLPF